MSNTIEKNWVHNDLPCTVVQTDLGHRCGYVGVTENHPLFEVDYSDHTDVLVPYMKSISEDVVDMDKIGVINLLCVPEDYMDKPSPVLVLRVHGGITFAALGDKYPIETKDKVWWFGYDCAHLGDGPIGGGPIRTLDYCISECELLADQLVKVEEVTKLGT